MQPKLKCSLLSCLLLVLSIAASGHSRSVDVEFTYDAVSLEGIPRVYDGDSIFFGKAEVRLTAIDAPEKNQACRTGDGTFWPCGIAARDALLTLIGKREVRCVLQGKDRYRRYLGTCFAGDIDLNAAMVKNGYAIAYHYFSEKYASEERSAKNGKLHIWQDADFTEPYYCRHFRVGHVCYVYDFALGTGRVATLPPIGRQ